MLEKKELEAKYLEMARSATSLIPAGDVEPGEKPDLRIRTASGLLGIEITKLHQTAPQDGEAPMEKRGRRHKVLTFAEELHKERGGADVTVEVFFSKVELPKEWKRVSEFLADFVQQHSANLPPNGTPHTFGVYSKSGIQHINIRPQDPEHPQWRELGESDRPQALRYEQVQAVIAKKNEKLSDYQSLPLGTWLLMIVDPFPRPAYLCVPNDLASWQFPSAFAKILLFSREENRVYELSCPRSTAAASQ